MQISDNKYQISAQAALGERLRSFRAHTGDRNIPYQGDYYVGGGKVFSYWFKFSEVKVCYEFIDFEREAFSGGLRAYEKSKISEIEVNV